MSRVMGVWRMLLPLLAVGCNRGCDRRSLEPAGAGGVGVVVGRAGSPGAGGAAGATGTGGVFGDGAQGVGGTGPIGGAGGSACSSNGLPLVPPVNCGDALCGNGHRDSCIWTSPCGPQGITEACDGADLNGQSCAAFGYASGAVACAANCTLDVTACSACVDAGPVPVVCDILPLGRPATVRIAATDSEIGMLFVIPGPLQPNLVFALRSADLKERRTAEIAGETVTATAGMSKDFDIAPFPGGWIVAGWGEGGIYIHALDANGVDRGRAPVGPGATGTRVEGPLLVPRPGGPPLIAWVTATYPPDGGVLGVLQTAAVSADGLSVGPTHGEAFEDWTRPHGIAFGGDLFVAAVVAGSASNPGQIRIRVIATDGTPTAAVDALPGVNATAVAPVGCDGGLCLVYHAMIPTATNPIDTGFLWTKVGATGAAVGDIVELSFWRDHDYQWAAPRAIGSDTATVMGGEPDGTIGLTRVTSTGMQQVIDSTILRERILAGAAPAITVRGPDLVIAWTETNKIWVARVGSPAP